MKANVSISDARCRVETTVWYYQYYFSGVNKQTKQPKQQKQKQNKTLDATQSTNTVQVLYRVKKEFFAVLCLVHVSLLL